MKTRRSRYHGHRFPAEIISHAVWLYHRFCLSFRDVEDLLAERALPDSSSESRRGANTCYAANHRCPQLDRRPQQAVASAGIAGAGVSHVSRVSYAFILLPTFINSNIQPG
jgi:transposase-like protein